MSKFFSLKCPCLAYLVSKLFIYECSFVENNLIAIYLHAYLLVTNCLEQTPCCDFCFEFAHILAVRELDSCFLIIYPVN